MAVDFEALGKRIRYYREADIISQERLAEMTELSCVHISNVERGKRVPSLETVVRIAIALNISVDELLSESLKDIHSKNRAREFEVLYGCYPEERTILLENMRVLRRILKRYKIKK